MDLSLRNSLRHIMNIWSGEENIRRNPSATEPAFSGGKLTNDLDNGSSTGSASLLKEDSIGLIETQSLLDRESMKGKYPDAGLPGELNFLPGEYQVEILRMAPIVGTYQHERNENLDEYFKALGVPFFARKMMGMSSPRLEITNEDDKWTIRMVSLMRTMEVTFVFGEEYEETMPSGDTLKSVTTMEGDSLTTVSVTPDNNKIIRKYEVTDDSVILTMTNEKVGQVAKRYFKRLS